MSLFHSLVKPKSDNSEAQQANERYVEELMRPYNDNVNYLGGYREYNKDLVYNKDTIRNYDAGTNEENHMIEKAYSLQQEMSISKMNNVLTEIKNKYSSYEIDANSVYTNLTVNNKINILVLCYHLLFQINETIINMNLSDEHHNFALFELNNHLLLTVRGKEIKFSINIFRKDKIYDFTIEAIVKYSVNTNKRNVKIEYSLLELKGINSDYEFNKTKYKKIPQDRGLMIDNIEKVNYKLGLDYAANVIATNYKNYQNNRLNPQYQDEYSKKIIIYPNHGCFITNDNTMEVDKLDIQNPIQCMSYWPNKVVETENYNKNGIWDEKCKLNTDCPFYDETRERGGCIDNACEMPIGVTRVGYRKYLVSSLNEARTHDDGSYMFLSDLKDE